MVKMPSAFQVTVTGGIVQLSPQDPAKFVSGARAEGGEAGPL